MGHRFKDFGHLTHTLGHGNSHTPINGHFQALEKVQTVSIDKGDQGSSHITGAAASGTSGGLLLS